MEGTITHTLDKVQNCTACNGQPCTVLGICSRCRNDQLDMSFCKATQWRLEVNCHLEENSNDTTIEKPGTSGIGGYRVFQSCTPDNQKIKDGGSVYHFIFFEICMLILFIVSATRVMARRQSTQKAGHVRWRRIVSNQ